MRQVLCPRLIGRDGELRTIRAALEAGREGRGGSIFLLGEAGVGKSRLAREAERLAVAQGMRVLWGRSVEGGAAVAYRAIAEALLSALRRDGLPRDQPELQGFHKILSRLIPDWREADPAPVDDSLVLLSEAVIRLLRAMGSHTGCLLVLEDLHWADSETLAVLEYLIANAATERLVILATSRPEASSAALALARSLAAHRVAMAMDLVRLTPAAVRAMARACLDDEEVPDAIERLLSASAEGLPLLVEDLLAEWVAAGALIHADKGWHVQHLVGPVVPISFGETVRRRVRGLGNDSARLLHLAALLGRHFDWTLLAPASGLDEDRVLELLRTAVEAQLLAADSYGFRFRHALTQAAILEELLPAQRTRQSARLLELVEAAHPQLDAEWCELAAELADAAGNRAKAATLLLDSGRKSLAQGALTTAEVTLERARALAPADADLRTEIDEALLHVLSEAGKHERAFEIGEELLAAFARSAAPPLRSAAVHLNTARAAVAGSRFAEARQHLDKARHMDAAGVLEARIDALSANVAIDERRLDDAERFARAALAAAERLSQPEVACEALVVIGRLARAHDLDRAEEAFGRAESLAEAHALTIWRCRALHELGTIDMFREASPRRLLEARTLAIDSGALVTAAWVDGELAALFNMRFELDRSLESAKHALEAGRRFRLRGVEAMAFLFVAQIYAYRLDRTALLSTLAELARVSGGDRFFSLGACECRAIGAFLEEDRPTATRELKTGMEFARGLPVASPSPSFGLWALLQTADNNLNGTQAREDLRRSWAMANPANRGFLAYAEAIALGRDGHVAEATQAVGEGDRRHVPGSWAFHQGRRLVAEAAIQDGWGEPAVWLREAEAFFDQNGYQAVSSACRSLLRKCGVPAVSGRAHRGVPEPFRGRGVTEREMEVLKILADGLSNKEIGTRLYLSPKTIEKHVASLMDKLGVRSRAQLATLAATNMGGDSARSWGKSPI